MLGNPGVVVAERVGGDDLLGHARMHVAVRIRFGLGVGVRREENAEFHQILPRAAAPARRPPPTHSKPAAALRGAENAGCGRTKSKLRQVSSRVSARG